MDFDLKLMILEECGCVVLGFEFGFWGFWKFDDDFECVVRILEKIKMNMYECS